MQHRFACDCHNHSCCSPDGNDSLSAMLERAQELGLWGYTVTDHCECNAYWERYRPRVQAAYEAMGVLEGEYKGPVRFYKGMELGQPSQDFKAAEDAVSTGGYDFIIGSMHNIRGFEDFFYLNYEKDSEEYVHRLLTAYFEEILEIIDWGKFDSLGHLTYPLRYIEGDHGVVVDMARHRNVVEEIFKKLICKNIALELNVSGLRQKIGRTLPDLPLLSRYYQLGGRLVTLGSDAHCVADLGKGIDEGMELLKQAGFQEFALYEKRSPRMLSLE